MKSFIGLTLLVNNSINCRNSFCKNKILHEIPDGLSIMQKTFNISMFSLKAARERRGERATVQYDQREAITASSLSSTSSKSAAKALEGPP